MSLAAQKARDLCVVDARRVDCGSRLNKELFRMRIAAVNRPDVPPLEVSSVFSMQVHYFMTPADQPGAPQLGPDEYWIRQCDARRWLEDLVVEVVSPLSAEIKAEVEVTEEQERWLEWMVGHGVEHIRIERS